jgi:hypothetical protein
MSVSLSALTPAAWEKEGRRLGTLFDAHGCALVVGEDPTAAALVALGIGRVQARYRRVAVADLAGDLEPLRHYVAGGETHGIVDSFQYGVSINRIAAPIDELGNLFVMPSGSDAVTEEILRSPRWTKLANGFRQEGALLLLVAPRAASGVDALVPATDGVVLVGDTPVPDGWPLLGTARPPRPPSPPVSTVSERRQQRSETPAWARRLGVGAALVGLAAIGVIWVGRARPVDDSAVATDAAGTAVPTGELANAAPAAPAIPVANPEDSARASRWAVEVMLANVEADARRMAATLADSVAGVVVTPVAVSGDSEHWFRVLVGAFADSSAADSALGALRARGLVSPDGGARVSRPFALLLQRDIPAEAAPGILTELAGRGIEGYALEQGDGTARLFAGAFAAPDEAESLAASLRLMGVEPTLVYRTGRAY